MVDQRTTKAPHRLLYSQVSTADVLQAYDWSSDAQDLPADWDTPSQEDAEDSTEAHGSSSTSSMYSWLHPKPTPDVRLKKDTTPLPAGLYDQHLSDAAAEQMEEVMQHKRGQPTRPARDLPALPSLSLSGTPTKKKTTSAKKPTRVLPSPVRQLDAMSGTPAKTTKQSRVRTADNRSRKAREGTVNILLRNVPADLADTLRAATAKNQSLPAYILALLTAHAETLEKDEYIHGDENQSPAYA